MERERVHVLREEKRRGGTDSLKILRSLPSPPQPLCYEFSTIPLKVLLKIHYIACSSLPAACPNPAWTGRRQGGPI